MTNSTWTQNHIQSLLARGKKGWLASLLLLDEVSDRKRAERAREEGRAPSMEVTIEGRARCQVLFPPCDTQGLVDFTLEGRSKRRGIVSLAQFR